MNAHRTALRAIAEQVAAEHRLNHGTEAVTLGRVHSALVAAINAGDEAEAAEVEDIDDDRWNEDVREGVQARITLDALRRALARTLGRPTVRRQILGPDVEVAPPVDGVLLADVEAVARRSGEYGALRSDLATVLGVDVLDDARLLGVVRERIAERSTEAAASSDRQVRALREALRVLVSASPDAWTNDEDVVNGVYAYTDNSVGRDRLDDALAALAVNTTREG